MTGKMNPWKDLSPGRNPPEEVDVFVEISKGSRNKFEIDKENGTIVLDRVLHKSFKYKWNYGLIPQTLAGDGDPADGVIIMEEPTPPGTIIPCRVVGIMHMIDDGEQDDKVIVVPIDDPDSKDIKDLSDIPEKDIAEMREWFENYKKAENKEVSVSGFEGLEVAKIYIKEVIELYKKKQGEN